MDSFGWNNEQLVVWSNNPDYCITSNKTELDESFFDSSLDSLGDPSYFDLLQPPQELAFPSGSSSNFTSLSGDSEADESSKSSKRKAEDDDVFHHQTETTTTGGFQIFFQNSRRSKKPRSDKENELINFQNKYEPDKEAIAQVKEMVYRAAMMRPLSLVLGDGDETKETKPKRKNVKISSDPQTVAARHRRERISERLRVLQKLVPGGSKMDTASMLDEAANYLKFLKSQASALETLGGGCMQPVFVQDHCSSELFFQ